MKGIAHLALACGGLLASGCLSAPVERPIAFADPPGFLQCAAESAVDWENSLSWVAEDQIAPDPAADPRRYSDLTGDDVVVDFYAGANIHVGRINYGRAIRRDGVWSYLTSESFNSLAPPPPPPPPGVEEQIEEIACTGPHFKARGAPGARLEIALNAFLADGCRAYVPGYTPAPLFMRDESARDCIDGAAYSLRVETARGVEHYRRGCTIPGSTLEDVMQAFEAARRPQDAVGYGPGADFSVTMASWRSSYERVQACRARAEALELDIDFDDPFEW